MRSMHANVMRSRPLRVIIPAKNEAQRIRETLIRYSDHFGEDATILVVANGCTDDTVPIVNDLRRTRPTITLLAVEAGIGKGGAVRAGLTVGNEPYIAIADADGSTSAGELSRLFETCRTRRLSGVIGSRWLPGAAIARKQTLKRRAASRAFNALVRLVFDLRYSDTQCGAKVFSRAAIDRVIEQLEIANFAFDVDLLLALKRLQLNILEVPIAWSDVPENSQVNLLRSGSSMFWALVRLRIRHSPLRGFPFLDMLARSSVIPVLAGLNVLVIRTPAHHPILDRVVDEFRRQGHRTTTFDLRGVLSIARFAWWYVSFGHRNNDIIIDCTAAPLSNLVALSAKPKINASSFSSLESEQVPVLTERTAKRCGYSALLWRDETGWKLSSSLLPATLVETV